MTLPDDDRETQRHIGPLPNPGLGRHWRWLILLSIALGCVALMLSPILFKAITDERQRRISTVSEIIANGCATDNDQDSLLAGLVAASLDPDAGFGEGIPSESLTAFDLQVIAAIARVSELQRAADGEITDKFERALAKLRDLTDCEQLVDDYVRGAGLDEGNVDAGAGSKAG